MRAVTQPARARAAARPGGQHVGRKEAVWRRAHRASVCYQGRLEPMPRDSDARRTSRGLTWARPSARPGGMLHKVAAVPAFVNFAAGGAAIAVLGALILETLVKAGAPPLAAQAVQLAVTLVLNFAYNYKITWRDRPRTGVRRQAAWFLATRAATQAASWSGFALLTSKGLDYQLAYGICLAGAMVINFITSDKLVFRRDEAIRRRPAVFRDMRDGGPGKRGKAIKESSSGAGQTFPLLPRLAMHLTKRGPDA